MSLITTIIFIVTFFLPGLAMLSCMDGWGEASTRAIFAPVGSALFFGVAGLIGWHFPSAFGVIAWITIGVQSLVSIAILNRTPGRLFLRQIDPVIPVAYLALAFVSTQMVFLPIKVPTTFPPAFDFTYFVRENVLPVRIQVLHHNLPVDNLLSFRFAEFILRGVDFKKPREEAFGDYAAIAPGQAVTARTPLMALIGAQYLKLFKPDIAVDGYYGHLGAFLNDNAYDRFFVVACCLNALMILPAYLFALKFANRNVARVTLLLLAINYSTIVESNFIWPKALGGYFALLFAYLVVSEKLPILLTALLAVLAYYSHQCAMGMICGASLLFAWRSRPLLPALLTLGAVAVLSFILVLPWSLWSSLSVGVSGNLISQNMFQNADLGIWSILGIRINNVLKTFIPHILVQTDSPTSHGIFASAFFTMPGALGLVATLFLGATLTRKNIGATLLCLCVVPTLVTTVMFGQSHGGLLPFGPFIFLPIGMALAVMACAELPSMWRRIFIALISLEQLISIWWGGIAPQWNSFATHSLHDTVRLLGVLALIALLGVASAALIDKLGEDSSQGTKSLRAA